MRKKGWFIIAIMWSAKVVAVPGTTTVTTYIVTTQEERESTRWTLTEWLRIKERMKLMDVWLAMFSEPAKDKFSPELSLYYGMRSGTSKATGILQPSTGGPDYSKLKSAGVEGRGQLWLTNLVSGTFGIRTLNVDFGFESYLALPITTTPAWDKMDVDAVEGMPAVETKSNQRYHCANFRIFGKNIQDSSFILKVGQYAHQNALLPNSPHGRDEVFNGTFGGVEMDLYLFRWLGLSGEYNSYLRGSANAVDFAGSTAKYGAYIEISLLRFMGGLFSEDLKYTDGFDTLREKRTGMYFGAMVNF